MKNKKRSSSLGVIVFMVAAVLFAALAGVLISHLLGQKFAKEPVRGIVVAARDVPSGRPLQKPDLRLAQWPVSSVPRGAYSAPDALLGEEAVPLIPLVAGEPILRSHMSKPRSGMGVAAKLGDDERAMALSTASSVTLARLIYPGAKVDILSTLRRPGSRWREVKTKVILQNVRVLAVGPHIDPLSALPRGGASKGKKGLGAARASDTGSAARRVVTVAVTPEQAERLVLARREGKLDLVLRSPGDEGSVATPGTTVASILGEAPDAEPAAAEAAGQGDPEPATRRSPRRRPRKMRRVGRRKTKAPEGPKGPEIYRVR